MKRLILLLLLASSSSWAVPIATPGSATDGVDATGIVAPTGASGIRGWLSGIYNRVDQIYGELFDRAASGTITTACADVNINSCASTSYVDIDARGSTTFSVITPDPGGGPVWTVAIDETFDAGVHWFIARSFDTRVNDTTAQNYCKDFSAWGNSLINDPWIAWAGGMDRMRLRAKVLTSGTVPVNMKASRGTFMCNPQNSAVTLGNSAAKTNVFVDGLSGAALVTTATTADQVAATYTVTSGKTLYMNNWNIGARLTGFSTDATTQTFYGTCSLESPAGTKLITREMVGTGKGEINKDYAEGIAFASGVVVRLVCTPNSATSTTWRANLTGFER